MTDEMSNKERYWRDHCELMVERHASGVRQSIISANDKESNLIALLIQGTIIFIPLAGAYLLNGEPNSELVVASSILAMIISSSFGGLGFWMDKQFFIREATNAQARLTNWYAASIEGSLAGLETKAGQAEAVERSSIREQSSPGWPLAAQILLLGISIVLMSYDVVSKLSAASINSCS